jgi:membrane protein DedA with SNARE-associated domain
MDNQTLIEIISTWGYPILFILVIVEGPLSTLTGAFLASMGILYWPWVLAISILGDIIGDTILYLIGRTGGPKVIPRASRLLKIKKRELNKLQRRFQKNGAKIIFFVKSTTGLGWITFILAGAAKIKFRLFLFYAFLGGIIWTSLLVFLGYFFGTLAEEINRYIRYAGWVIFVLAILLIFAISWIRGRKNKIDDFPDKK